MGNERGGIRSEGGGRELMGRPSSPIWCRLVVVGCPCCPSFGPFCRSFVVVCSFLSVVGLFCVGGVWHHSFGEGYRDGTSRELPLGG